ncbi:hypothetical protein [Malikia sp.]|uniref:hypothetical protein n=1 Tax=Malikia sp. TaxID=2070706 RepID=UPI002609C3F5|nr:hypothetical protein [Malikia sp.]MDD2728775.1 hypothetical protein [Malikia sp.]
MYSNKQALANTELLGPSRRFEQSLGELNARIARLAMLLDAPIATADDRQRLLDRQAPHFRRPDEAAAASGPAQRLTRGWEELRGLIVLRYEVLSNAASELGPQATTHLVLKVELELELDGFKRGASGFDLLSWLDS